MTRGFLDGLVNIAELASAYLFDHFEVFDGEAMILQIRALLVLLAEALSILDVLLISGNILKNKCLFLLLGHKLDLFGLLLKIKTLHFQTNKL